MTFEEFKEIRQHQKEIKKTMPAMYNDIFNLYESYSLEYARNRNEIEILYYELENVKGVNYAKEKSTYNQDRQIEKYYSISDRIKDLEQANTFIANVLKGLEGIRDSIANKEIRDKATEGYFNVLFG